MNKWWKYSFRALLIIILVSLVGLGIISGIFVNLPKIISCNKQMSDYGIYGIASSPLKLVGMKEIVTIGCPHNFEKDTTKPHLITFNFIMLDSKGFPYIYEMKIDENLSVCRSDNEEVKCGRESIEEYEDFPEGKVVVVGIVNSEIPNKEIDMQPDFNYLSRLEKALVRGSWYPMQLFKKRIQVWSLSY